MSENGGPCYVFNTSLERVEFRCILFLLLLFYCSVFECLRRLIVVQRVKIIL